MQKRKQDEHYLFKTVQHNNVTINIYRPILTEQEQKKREKQIMGAVARILCKYDNLEDGEKDE